MDEGGVDAAVIHPPGWHPNSTEMAFKAVRDFPGRFAILGGAHVLGDRHHEDAVLLGAVRDDVHRGVTPVARA